VIENFANAAVKQIDRHLPLKTCPAISAPKY
jgi:hypothetical protein